MDHLAQKFPAVCAPMSRIIALGSAHFLGDLLSCMLFGFLPKALEYFNLHLSWGVMILAFMSISSNLLQIPVSMLDRRNVRPRMLLTGIVLAGSLVLLGLLPPGTPVPVLCLLMILVGTGVALIHPFGLRGIQRLSNFAPTVTTPAFMTGGFFGSAVGPFLGALLVGSFGMSGLLWMLLPVAAVFAAVHYTHIRLAVDEEKTESQANAPLSAIDRSAPWSFSGLMVVALLLNMGTTIFQSLIPTHLYRAGLPLAFGGLSAMLFGAGSTAGSLTMGYLAKKHRIAPFVMTGMAIGVPMTALYLHFSPHYWALALVFFSGMFACSGFPMMVFLARSAPGGLPLGARMAWIVGGTWGFAGLFFLGIGQLTKIWPVSTVINVSWCCYLAALAVAVFLRRKDGSETGKSSRQALY